MTVDEAAGPVQVPEGCRGMAAEICNLRIYQVMVESFVDGDSKPDYDAGYGPSHHKGDVVPSPEGRLPVDSTAAADYGSDPSGYSGKVVDYDDPRTVEFFKEVATYWIEELGG